MSAVKRRYRQTARAASADGLRQKIVLAFYELMLARWIDEITLDEVAASAGTTRQSVIRLFGGKEGLLEAVIEFLKAQAAPRIFLPLSLPRRAAIEALVQHYEVVGDMTFRLLAQEERHPALRPQLEFGRRGHRAWIAERFAAALEGLDEGSRERRITRLVVATDLYTWKLLRRDFGRSETEVAELIAGMVDGNHQRRGDMTEDNTKTRWNESGRLRVLTTYWDGGGNVPPQRALARELTRRGHEVHVLTHNSLRDAVVSDGATFHPLATAPQWDGAQPHAPGAETEFIVHHLGGSAAFASDFLSVHDALRPDISVIDVMLFTTLRDAAKRGLPYVALNHLAWNLEAGVVAKLGGLAAHHTGLSFFELVERAPTVLATTYPEFGTARGVPPHVHFVGPIREPVAAAPWPRRFPERPFVLVSLSSVFQEQEETLRNICKALAPLPLEVLVTTGRGVALGALPISGGLEARPFVPHDAVLPSVDLVVTHGGLGTAMFSAGAGVPVLCLPNGRDQDDNAARVEALGLGRALVPRGRAGRDRASGDGDARRHALRENCRAFAARVSRFGDLRRAADLVIEFARASLPRPPEPRASAPGVRSARFAARGKRESGAAGNCQSGRSRSQSPCSKSAPS